MEGRVGLSYATKVCQLNKKAAAVAIIVVPIQLAKPFVVNSLNWASTF